MEVDVEAIKNWGAVQGVKSKICALWWYKFDLDCSLRSIGKTKKSEESGVAYDGEKSFIDELNEAVAHTREDMDGVAGTIYYIEGCHDAYRLRSPLYIGKTAGESKERMKIKKGSLGWFFYLGEKEVMWDAADTWDITVRWAFVTKSSDKSNVGYVDEIEKMMIRYHKPVYNIDDRRGALDFDLTVLNVGAKGTMLPVCASRYFAASNKWPAETDPEVDIANSPE